MASGRLRLHARRCHALARYGHIAEQVAQEVQQAQAGQFRAPFGATPATALEHALDRCRQGQVAIRGHMQIHQSRPWRYVALS